MEKVILSHNDMQCLVSIMVEGIIDRFKGNPFTIKVFPIPRGGVPVAYLLSMKMQGKVVIVDTPEEADIFIDDIIDSGKTKNIYLKRFPYKLFFAAINKHIQNCPFKNKWVVFPWEETAEKGIHDHITRLISFAGDDPSREGLQETPTRVAKALKHWFSGYGKDPASILKTFEDGAESYDEMIIVKDIPFYSHCEHHIAPIFGIATIAYIPNKRIVGLSKLSRLLDLFARRLQVQERLTTQIADALWEHLQPRGVGVIIKARHMCMESRGICQQGHHTITSALYGVIKDQPETRAEFIALVK